jgi:hypothetical protein
MPTSQNREKSFEFMVEGVKLNSNILRVAPRIPPPSPPRARDFGISLDAMATAAKGEKHYLTMD